MEHGIITSVQYQQGVVLCDVQAIRIDTEYENVPMLKPFAEFTVVPQLREKVAMVTLDDGSRFITDVLSRTSAQSRPDDLASGELAIQFDENTKLTFTKQSGGYHIDIEADSISLSSTDGSSVTVDGVNVANHTHDYEDDNGSGTTTKTTESP